jgi:hypothetical protein
MAFPLTIPAREVYSRVHNIDNEVPMAAAKEKKNERVACF